MTFDRNKLFKKSPKKKSIYTNNGRENERANKEPKPPFHERMGIWSYTLTTISLGIAIGVLFGAYAYSLTVTTDEKLKEDIVFYKEQKNIANNESDSLKHENELLLSEKENLQQQLTDKTKENKNLNESLNKVNEELKEYKERETNTNSLSKTQGNGDTKEKLTSKHTLIKDNDSASFFEGRINVAAFGITSYSTDIQIGAEGYESQSFLSARVGSQFSYEAESKYQVRISKIDSDKKLIVVQVTKF